MPTVQLRLPTAHPSQAPAGARAARRWLLPSCAAAVLFALYAALSIQEHRQHLTSGFDLGIFVQEVRSYAAGHWPVSTLKGPGFPLLGDHFSPIVASIAPLYRLFPSAYTLLIVQAALLAVAVVPLTRWARSTLGLVAAVVVAISYGLSWGIAGAIGFDFHEVAFAVPLIAFAAVAYGEGRHTAALWWAAPLVLVKEDLGLTVAVLGFLVALRGRRLLGLSAALAGIAATAVETLVILPAVNPAGHYAYSLSPIGVAGLGTDLAQLLSPSVKLFTLACLLAPTALLALRSPLLLLVVPTLTWRFLSENPAYWGTADHYSAVLMPIVFAAFIDALNRGAWYRRTACRGAVLATSLLVTAALLPAHAFVRLATPSFWRTAPQVVAADQLLADIPDNVPVAASDWLAPQLTSRDDVSLFGGTPLTVSHADYVIVDTRYSGAYPVSRARQLGLIAEAEADGYRLIGSIDGIDLLHRDS